MYKKIALACATLATAGILMTGCIANKADADFGLRKRVYNNVKKIEECNPNYTISEGEYEITAMIDKGWIIGPKLEVSIKNKSTGDILKMTDFDLNGVDSATYNGVKGGSEGLDKRFDEALRKIDSKLEQKILTEVEKVKQNTKLE